MTHQKPTLLYNIDITGTCNLSCPACPCGNSPKQKLHLMEFDYFKKLIDKIKYEAHVKRLDLYCWSEPLLHPQIGRFINYAREQLNTEIMISSNMKCTEHLKSALLAKPTLFRVSCPSLRPKIYEKYHKGAEFHTWMDHVKLLAYLRDTIAPDVKCDIIYHRYIDTVNDEPSVRAFAHELGFKFVPVWAHIMPIENMFRVHNCSLSSDLYNFCNNNLCYDIKEVLQYCAGSKECDLQDYHVTINSYGHVQLCCGFFDSNDAMLGSYLDYDISYFQTKKQHHYLCKVCKQIGIPDFYCFKTLGHQLGVYKKLGSKVSTKILTRDIAYNLAVRVWKKFLYFQR